jgi:hypothetical protein
MLEQGLSESSVAQALADTAEMQVHGRSGSDRVAIGNALINRMVFALKT